MPLTHTFNQTTKPYIQQSPAFRAELLADAVSTMLAGDLDRGKAVLRMYVNGAIGFIPLAAQLSRSPKTLMRILSPAGNPQARTLFHLLAHLQRAEAITLKATAEPAPPQPSSE